MAALKHPLPSSFRDQQSIVEPRPYKGPLNMDDFYSRFEK